MSDSKRPRVIEVDELARANPKVDAEQLREAQKLVAALRESGLEPPSYGIASPYQRAERRAK